MKTKTLHSFFCKNTRLKNAQKFKNMLRTNLRLRKGEELVFWILHKVTVTICFSDNVRQCNIAYSVHVELWDFLFKSYISFLPARVAGN